jgi:hypothetical protein
MWDQESINPGPPFQRSYTYDPDREGTLSRGVSGGKPARTRLAPSASATRRPPNWTEALCEGFSILPRHPSGTRKRKIFLFQVPLASRVYLSLCELHPLGETPYQPLAPCVLEKSSGGRREEKALGVGEAVCASCHCGRLTSPR